MSDDADNEGDRSLDDIDIVESVFDLNEDQKQDLCATYRIDDVLSILARHGAIIDDDAVREIYDTLSLPEFEILEAFDDGDDLQPSLERCGAEKAIERYRSFIEFWAKMKSEQTP